MCRLQTDYEKYKHEQNVALEMERKTTSDLSGSLEEEKRRHADTHSLLEQVAHLVGVGGLLWVE